ncbi:MAG: BON domain-containing protein [Dechloromonas sp.]|uniref:BON domain-containing protein n=1 Tax=Candidatus Dechloromonas phosphorivorans TaxID=2899244 RepID=A0A935K154_9RHOO|nr:BON domain-containing protein [Candidatus Dechloromonas phosphorivorans]
MLASVAGYTADSAPTTYVKDLVNTTKAMLNWPLKRWIALIPHWRRYHPERREAVLTGTVKTKAPADKAVSITRAVKGVASVDNQIKVVAEK